MRRAPIDASPWGGAREGECTKCGSPIRVGRGQVDRSRDNRTDEVVVTWTWQCGCGRKRRLRRVEGVTS